MNHHIYPNSYNIVYSKIVSDIGCSFPFFAFSEHRYLLVFLFEGSGVDRNPIAVNIRFFVAQAEHFSNFAQLIAHQPFRVALLNDVQVLHEHYPLDVEGHF